MSAGRLRIALAKGRLWDAAIARFTRAGMAPLSDRGRRLLVPSEDPGIEFLEIKPGDVPIYVESGAADLGITGTDVLREANPDVLEPLELDFGQCRLVVAAPAGCRLSGAAGRHHAAARDQVSAARARTLRGPGPRASRSSRSAGSVEVAPLLGLSHWIVDLVDTGNTLKANGLVEHETILNVRATLIANRASQKLKLEDHLEVDGATGKGVRGEER